MNSEVKYWIKQYQIIVIALVILSLFFLFLMYLSLEHSGNICYNMVDLNKTFERIDKNCGSTFITHKYGSNDWFVFKANVCDGKECKSVYIPIEDCLK